MKGRHNLVMPVWSLPWEGHPLHTADALESALLARGTPGRLRGRSAALSHSFQQLWILNLWVRQPNRKMAF